MVWRTIDFKAVLEFWRDRIELGLGITIIQKGCLGGGLVLAKPDRDL